MKKYIYLLIFSLIISVTTLSYGSEQSIENKTPSLLLQIKTDKENNQVIEGEEITLYISSDKDCYIIVIKTDSKGNSTLLFPNKSHTGYDISGGSDYKIPGFNMKKITITGNETIKATGMLKEGFFDDLIKPSEAEDYKKIEKEFNKKLKEKINTLSKEEWATEELVISAKKPSVYINPEVNDILKKNIDTSFQYYAQGTAYYEQKKYDDAIKQFKKVIELTPNIAFAYYSLGLSYQAKGAFKEAIDYYKKCLNQGVKERDCYIRVGEIYDQSGDKKEALDRYKKALRITEGYEKINNMNPSDTGKEKIYDLEMKCKDNPSDKESRTELAAIYEKLGKYKASSYHLKMLLSQAIPLYKPCRLEEDKPSIEKPVEEVPEAAYYYVESYTYYAPYPAPYTPPPPPPVKDSPSDFDF